MKEIVSLLCYYKGSIYKLLHFLPCTEGGGEKGGKYQGKFDFSSGTF